ncbi:hypothetical protein [Mycolicibacterium vulneris]|jgi:hypothetical protein|uniref:hypothetical protein n=1 Tax=Mycolicibacterium vulneris TaxID=547163 RepID=UPI001055B518|nr:hypothetical protein [Mycolicibacterium vulneris]
MRIGRNEALSNSASLRNLPNSIIALYELSRLLAEDIEQGIAEGEITSDMVDTRTSPRPLANDAPEASVAMALQTHRDCQL